ncbi:hypothetical protein HMPREF3069_03140 [Achromobacter xylosoxidans]|nr:hypothetical protein HMPREF2772_07295 [Achromobacter xylosoxidans]OFO60978.1 hypothetical protein HMPREF3024_24530 [Achromobacter xylosoxidans]OFS65062.1 hypothetical protein HMPREF3069_03140 [Achromobacter xylosoxidans]OMG81373.1 hypothetical protein BIZ53_29280 [Achromobacter xylosoxidans]PNL98298.1 hypothetical protein A6J83_024585 [Achromobacter xylosoxidans]
MALWLPMGRNYRCAYYSWHAHRFQPRTMALYDWKFAQERATERFRSQRSQSQQHSLPGALIQETSETSPWDSYVPRSKAAHWRWVQENLMP